MSFGATVLAKALKIQRRICFLFCLLQLPKRPPCFPATRASPRSPLSGPRILFQSGQRDVLRRLNGGFAFARQSPTRAAQQLKRFPTKPLVFVFPPPKGTVNYEMFPSEIVCVMRIILSSSFRNPIFWQYRGQRRRNIVYARFLYLKLRIAQLISREGDHTLAQGLDNEKGNPEKKDRADEFAKADDTTLQNACPATTT